MEVSSTTRLLIKRARISAFRFVKLPTFISFSLWFSSLIIVSRIGLRLLGHCGRKGRVVKVAVESMNFVYGNPKYEGNIPTYDY